MFTVPLGLVWISLRASMDIHDYVVQRAFLERHRRGDWGDVTSEQAETNNQAVATGRQIRSVYHTTDGSEIWVITKSDRTETLMLTPNDWEPQFQQFIDEE